MRQEPLCSPTLAFGSGSLAQHLAMHLWHLIRSLRDRTTLYVREDMVGGCSPHPNNSFKPNLLRGPAYAVTFTTPPCRYAGRLNSGVRLQQETSGINERQSAAICKPVVSTHDASARRPTPTFLRSPTRDARQAALALLSWCGCAVLGYAAT